MGSTPRDPLSRVAPASRVAPGSGGPETLVAELPRRVRDLLDADSVAVFLLSDDGASLIRRAWIGTDTADDSVPVSTGFADRVAARRSPLASSGEDASARTPGGMRSWLGAPIVLDGRLLGVIQAGTRAPRHFSESDIELLEFAAVHVAVAIDRARLHDIELTRGDAPPASLRRDAIDRYRRIERDVIAALADAADPRQALPDVLRLAATGLGWSVAQLWTVDPNVDVLRWKDVWVADETFREFVSASQATRLPRGAGLPGRAWDTGESAWICDLLEDETFSRAPYAATSALRSGAACPVRSAGRTYGVVEFFSTLPKPIDHEMVGTLESIATQIGQMIHRGVLEEERERLIADAVEQLRARDDIVATLSHELRTPVNAVIGWLQMIRSGDLDEGRRERALETIERNVRLQAQLVEDLIDLTRLARGALRLDLQLCFPAESVDAALDTIEPSAAAKDVRIRRALDRTAGPVLADPDRLQQIVWNLVSNAVKYTSGGGLVIVRVERVDDTVRLIVTDTGQGIHQEFLPHVFEPFRQSHHRTPEGRPLDAGLGLGLAIVKQLATLQGGTVEAASEGEGQGATFTISLPLRSA